MSKDHTEDKLVQETTINYFRETLEWETAYAHNTEILGKDGSFGREDEKAVILTRYLSQALETLKYDHLFVSLPVESYSDFEVEERSQFVFNHIYQQYAGAEDNVYAAVSC
ncbi:hypothetical protein QUF72_01570 [Desulfobacterales bacterium HSG2]|nr:hypothetical protein [Desulfobacterales bacterium HSG2]